MLIVFGSSNKGKLEEVSRVVSGYPSIQLVGVDAMKEALGTTDVPEICESGVSYEANAMKKATGYSAWCHRPVIADDTGLEISALQGLPGIYTARFGIERVRQLLQGQHAYAARFVCCMCYAEPNGRAVSVTQTLEGELNIRDMQRRIDSALPFSHFFTPRGEKTNLYDLVHNHGYRSHRGRALETLLASML